MATKTRNPAPPAERPRGGARSLKDRDVVRLTADVPTKDANLLEELARRTGYNKVTTILRALRTLDALETANERGATILIENADGTKERLLLR